MYIYTQQSQPHNVHSMILQFLHAIVKKSVSQCTSSIRYCMYIPGTSYITMISDQASVPVCETARLLHMLYGSVLINQSFLDRHSFNIQKPSTQLYLMWSILIAWMYKGCTNHPFHLRCPKQKNKVSLVFYVITKFKLLQNLFSIGQS